MVISEDPWHSHTYGRAFSSEAVNTNFYDLVCCGWDSNTQPSACGANALTDCVTTAVFLTRIQMLSITLLIDVKLILLVFSFRKISAKNYLLVAAIDFGTTYSGYAFTTREDFKIELTRAYLKHWVDPASQMVYHKTSTCVLFDKDRKFSKFGFEAETKYTDLLWIRNINHGIFSHILKWLYTISR